jgi:hypothetical protein
MRLGAAQCLDRIGEPLVERGHAFERVDRAGDQRQAWRRARRRCRRSRSARCRRHQAATGRARRLCSASAPLVGARGELVDLAELPGEPLTLALGSPCFSLAAASASRASRQAAQAPASGRASTCA